MTEPVSRRTAAERLAGLNEFQRREFPARLSAHDAASPGYTRRWYQLEDILVGLGGTATVVGFDPDGHLDELLTAGRPFPVAGARRVAGERNACHTNASREWFAEEAAVTIVTGYALSSDGLWRQHSWLVDAPTPDAPTPGVDGTGADALAGAVVLETTEPRTSYFGVPLSFPQAAVFAASHLPGIDPSSLPAPSVGFAERIVAVLGPAGGL